MKHDVQYSRPLATAERLAAFADDHHQFTDKHVLLTGESDILMTENGGECLFASLRLLIRICRYVSVALPPECEHLLIRCRQEIEPLAFGGSLCFGILPVDLSPYDAILSIGSIVKPALPWTVINSNSWVARVSSGNQLISSACREPNPIASLAAASLGVAEVFKRLIRLKPDRGELFDGLSFNLWNYRTGEEDTGFPVPQELNVDLVLAGTGAIGNGIVYLLSKLPIRGRINLVDVQAFGRENLGTCILIGPSDIGRNKVEVAASFLSARIQTEVYKENLSSFKTRLGSETPYPRLILNGLDNIKARHTVQSLWPDMIIDGAIGDLSCQVSRHPWGEDIACLMCLFKEPPGESAVLVESRATGLSSTRVHQVMDIVTEADVQTAPPEKKEQLRKYIGRQICSVVQEEMARLLSDRKLDEGFAPSVPFVACLSASMVVGEMVKYLAGLPSPLATRFQFDVLRGPAYGQMFPQERRRDCVCVTRAHNIEIVRQRHNARFTV